MSFVFWALGLTRVLGSDILAHKSASNDNGIVTAEAREEVLERTSEYFAPELLNRLDSMLVFNKLSRSSILQVVSLRLNDVAERLKNRRITVDVDDKVRDWLAQEGYSDIYGARAIARVVRTKVLLPLAQKLLNGTIRSVLCVILPLWRQHITFSSAGMAMSSLSVSMKTLMLLTSKTTIHLTRR